MNAYEFNKIAGWALSALLFIFGMQAAGEMFGGSHHGPAKAGYTLPAPKGGPAAAAPAAEAFNFAKVSEHFSKVTADAGKETFTARCFQCHTSDKGGAIKQGPNLFGVVGRDIGKGGGFTRFSKALADKGGKWDMASLAAYLYDPKGYIPGNQMSFPGLKDEQELAALLAYMNTLADSPVPLPK